MTTPLTEGLLTVPYVGVAEFRSAPTWLDTEDLVEGGLDAAQDAELYNTLLRASSWAWNYCDQPLHAHQATQNLRARVDRWGRAFIHPDNSPVRAVAGIAFGSDPTLMSVVSDLTGTWIEDERGLIVSLAPSGGAFLGSLQFGSVPPPGGEVFVTIQYVAGYGNTYVTQASAAADTVLHVADPTGFVPPQTSVFGTQIGASVARIWEPGSEEAVTIASGYTAGANPLVFASPMTNAHSVGMQVSEIPAEAREAVIAYAVALLLRDDASEEAPFPGSPGPTARRSAGGGAAGGLIEDAERLLMRYRRTR